MISFQIGVLKIDRFFDVKCNIVLFCWDQVVEKTFGSFIVQQASKKRHGTRLILKCRKVKVMETEVSRQTAATWLWNLEA